MVITTLDSLIERVMAEDAKKYDFLADTRRMSVSITEKTEDEGPRLLLNVDESGVAETFHVSDHARGQMATDLGIPKRYFDRMVETAPELLKQNTHHWLYAEPTRRMIRARTQQPELPAARAWLSDRYRRLDNIEIARKLLPEFDRLSEEVVFHNASVTDEKFYLRATFPRLTSEVKVGEPVQWGVQIKNSEVGAATFAIESFVLTLACTNGMVVGKVLNARHIGKRLDESLSDEAIQADDRAFWLAARDMLRASISETEFEKVISTLRETTDGVRITAPIAATERLAKEFSLSEAEQEAVLTSLASGGDFSRWGALSAITNAAQTVESFDRRVEMEEMGWSLATATNREWERIAVAA